MRGRWRTTWAELYGAARSEESDHEHDRIRAVAGWFWSATAWPGCARWRKSWRARPHAFSITVFGAEPHGNYNRIMLSPVLAGEKTFADIITHDRAWYEQNGIELIAGEAVTAIDRDNRVGDRRAAARCGRTTC